ncbi:hypothetical protein EMN47_03675 [Prolixibacteraceae bacterium JC049]|nr:hypothetical protein [Prolixibacteraceae bacterium JC049]
MNIKKHIASLYLIICLLFAIDTKAQESETPFADSWEFIGIAVEEPGYTIWGTSPIMGDDGKIHLFVARWPKEQKVDPGWRTHSEIAHYVGNTPEGPFQFVDVALKGNTDNKDAWDRYAPHNPTIHKVGDKYVLLYIANTGMDKHPANQCIGMATSKSLNGPWKKVGKDGLILHPPKNKKYWNYNASNGVNNPAFLQHPNGGFYLYFKSERARMGLAVAENLEGPYVQMPFPVTTNNTNIEDGYAFMHNDKFMLLTTDNHGMIESGGGILWESTDGIHFNRHQKAYHRINHYHPVDQRKVTVFYGGQGNKYSKIERPQVLLIDGKPRYLYGASGTNIYGGSSTVSYVLKFKEQ